MKRARASLTYRSDRPAGAFSTSKLQRYCRKCSALRHRWSRNRPASLFWASTCPCTRTSRAAEISAAIIVLLCHGRLWCPGPVSLRFHRSLRIRRNLAIVLDRPCVQKKLLLFHPPFEPYGLLPVCFWRSDVARRLTRSFPTEPSTRRRSASKSA